VVEAKSIIALFEVWSGILAGVIDSQAIVFEKFLPGAGVQKYLRIVRDFRLIVFSYQPEDVVFKPHSLAGEIGAVDSYFLSRHVWKLSEPPAVAGGSLLANPPATAGGSDYELAFN
jgi:hypothetical protein